MLRPYRLPIALLGCLVISFAGTRAHAKRSAPQEVAPVTIDGIEYRVPMGVDKQGYVEAYTPHTAQLLWSRQIYVVLKDPLLEGDVQDVFISSLHQDGADNALLIATEAEGQYRLDLKSLEVKVLKGSIAVRRGR